MADMKGMNGHGMHDMQNMSGMKNMQEAKPGQVAMAEGEVKKVDFTQGKVTLKHGPLDNLEMPAMTMVFKVADSAMLSNIKSGDMVRFQADKVDGALTVTKLEK
ncbi:copper-binding protein [Keguizhuia sedimenti]